MATTATSSTPWCITVDPSTPGTHIFTPSDDDIFDPPDYLNIPSVSITFYTIQQPKVGLPT